VCQVRTRCSSDRSDAPRSGSGARLDQTTWSRLGSDGASTLVV
jgi:hypothetical protein